MVKPSLGQRYFLQSLCVVQLSDFTGLGFKTILPPKAQGFSGDCFDPILQTFHPITVLYCQRKNDALVLPTTSCSKPLGKPQTLSGMGTAACLCPQHLWGCVLWASAGMEGKRALHSSIKSVPMWPHTALSFWDCSSMHSTL